MGLKMHIPHTNNRLQLVNRLQLAKCSLRDSWNIPKHLFAERERVRFAGSIDVVAATEHLMRFLQAGRLVRLDYRLPQKRPGRKGKTTFLLCGMIWVLLLPLIRLGKPFKVVDSRICAARTAWLHPTCATGGAQWSLWREEKRCAALGTGGE